MTQTQSLGAAVGARVPPESFTRKLKRHRLELVYGAPGCHLHQLSELQAEARQNGYHITPASFAFRGRTAHYLGPTLVFGAAAPRTPSTIDEAESCRRDRLWIDETLGQREEQFNLIVQRLTRLVDQLKLELEAAGNL